jgi:hypothetical protein
MSIDYPWYEIVEDEDPRQGDMLQNCPIVIPPTDLSVEACEEEPPQLDYELYDVVVMSQSCDLAYEKLKQVLLSPYGTIAHFQTLNRKFIDSNLLEKIRRGNVPGYHMLRKCDLDGFHDSHLIVDFRSTFSVDFDFLMDFVRNSSRRLRVLPPYREHLSQAFARFMMRVGLPQDIPNFA